MHDLESELREYVDGAASITLDEVAETRSANSRRSRVVAVAISVCIALVGLIVIATVVATRSHARSNQSEVAVEPRTTRASIASRDVTFGVFKRQATATDALPEPYKTAFSRGNRNRMIDTAIGSRLLKSDGSANFYLVPLVGGNYCEIAASASSSGGGAAVSCGINEAVSKYGFTAVSASHSRWVALVPDIVERLTVDGRELPIVDNIAVGDPGPGATIVASTAEGDLPPFQLPATQPTPAQVNACASGGGVTPVAVTLRMVGGPPPGIDRPLAGTVVAVADSGRRCSVDVGAASATRFDLPAGVYTVTGRSPTYGDGKYECSAQRKVTVAARPPNSHGGPTLVNVVCPAR